jgi:hypothetical protein
MLVNPLYDLPLLLVKTDVRDLRSVNQDNKRRTQHS